MILQCFPGSVGVSLQYWVGGGDFNSPQWISYYFVFKFLFIMSSFLLPKTSSGKKFLVSHDSCKYFVFEPGSCLFHLMFPNFHIKRENEYSYSVHLLHSDYNSIVLPLCLFSLVMYFLSPLNYLSYICPSTCSHLLPNFL